MKPAVRVALALALLAVATMAAAAARPQSEAPGADVGDPPPQDFFSDAAGYVGQWIEHAQEEFMPTQQPVTDSDRERNRRAFSRMVADCEGTTNAGDYRALYGSRPGAEKTFDSFADHPRRVSRISATDQRWTSAAGRHQWMAVSPIPGGGSTRVDTWDRMARKLGLRDFSPASQEAAFLALVAECGALADVDAGRVLEAARKCRSQWASLPGANYAGQGMRTPDYVVAAYRAAGGAVA